jgi:hypothetical protein
VRACVHAWFLFVRPSLWLPCRGWPFLFLTIVSILPASPGPAPVLFTSPVAFVPCCEADFSLQSLINLPRLGESWPRFTTLLHVVGPASFLLLLPSTPRSRDSPNRSTRVGTSPSPFFRFQDIFNLRVGPLVFTLPTAGSLRHSFTNFALLFWMPRQPHF